MQKNSNDFSMQEATRLARSPAGQQLLSKICQSNSAQMDEALQQFQAGNYDQAKQLLAPLLSSPELQELIRKLGG